MMCRIAFCLLIIPVTVCVPLIWLSFWVIGGKKGLGRWDRLVDAVCDYIEFKDCHFWES